MWDASLFLMSGFSPALRGRPYTRRVLSNLAFSSLDLSRDAAVTVARPERSQALRDRFTPPLLAYAFCTFEVASGCQFLDSP